MESSSTSSIDKSFKYDVFLSFRGEDTRTNFVDHLYHALQDKGIYTYKDNERITKGKRISDELIKSIEDSKFYIVVFSKNYASSSWCLDELVKIMECHKTAEHAAYPIFYDVEPTEVRKQSGAVGEAFAQHEKADAAGKWRDALKEAADLAGWELIKTADGHEAKFIQIIVEQLALELCSIDFSIDEKLVGMETRVKDMVSSLEIGIDNVRMIGIKGMGGGGKTTLARAVFDNIMCRFEGASFIENVREVSSTSSSGLESLQKKILSDIFNDKEISIRSVHDGKTMMKRRMRGRKVLIVLDDVNHINQLEALAGGPYWFKPGSRIIITTRDEKVLLAHKVTLIHDVDLLSDEEAICLFSRYAFGREIPIEGYQELSERAVSYAAGLPLTVTVLGSFLCGEDKPEWEDALERLKTIPLTETLKILELSYTALEDDYKEIFLDIACIMKCWSKDKAIKALESCGFHARIGLRVLQQKSLITIYEDDLYGECVGMHDSIQEMGMNIVRRSHPDMPKKHSRLWKNDEIEHIFANDLGTEEIRCIELDTRELDPKLLIKGLGKMKALRFLSVRMYYYSGNLETDAFCTSFPDALRYLCWEGYPFRSLPKIFQANNLVTLEMPQSEIIQLWEGGDRKVLDKLRFLDLSYSKLKTLDLDLTPNLEILNLRDCHDLLEIPGGDRKVLDKLRFLDLSCSKLKTLDLDLTPNLEMLNLSDCHDLVELPDDVWKLEQLKSLDLYACVSLKDLPEVFRRLECSENLNLSTTEIKHLPDNISLPTKLKDLRLAHCERFQKLPEDLGHLECLESLDLSDTMLEHLPDSIILLKHLKILKLHHCKRFVKLPEDLRELESLKVLDLSCTYIEHLPDSICELKHLESLNLEHCYCLKKLPEDLGRLRCLGLLNLSNTRIERLPDSIVMLKNLCILNLDECGSLEKLPEDLRGLECLEELHLSATNIRHLPDSICQLKHLKSLNLNCCWLLEKLPEELGHLECLEELCIGATRISHLPQSLLMLNCLCVYGSRGSLEVSDKIQISYYDDDHVFNPHQAYDYVAGHKCYYDYDYTYTYDYTYDYDYTYTYTYDYDYTYTYDYD